MGCSNRSTSCVTSSGMFRPPGRCASSKQSALIGGAFSTRGVHVLWPKRLAKVLIEQTAGDVDVARLRESVASRFTSV